MTLAQTSLFATMAQRRFFNGIGIPEHGVVKLSPRQTQKPRAVPRLASKIYFGSTIGRFPRRRTLAISDTTRSGISSGKANELCRRRRDFLDGQEVRYAEMPNHQPSREENVSVGRVAHCGEDEGSADG